MAQNTVADAKIAPLTAADIKAAADGHDTTTDELRAAVRAAAEGIDEYATEFADAVPEGHGQYSEPTVIWQDNDHVCIYVSTETWNATMEELSERYDGDTPHAVVWAHNEFARRHGASADVLGTMDAIVLPRTETVQQIINDRR